MKKHISLIAIVIIIIALTVPIVYGTSNINSINKVQESKFFTTDVTQAAVNDIVTMTLDLSKIDYDNFEFILSSDISVENIVADTTSKENVSVDNKENKITIISNKSDVNMQKIQLYYKVPEEIEVGTKINLKATICKYDNEKIDTISENTQISNNTIINTNTTTDTTTDIQTQKVEVTITIVEDSNNSNSSNSQNNNLNNESMQEINSNNNIQNQDKNNSNGSSTQQNGISLETMEIANTVTSSKTANTGSLGNTETVRYNGSYDNYLNSITVDSYNINPEFAKTTSTYFITVANDVTSVNVNVTKSDENAKVQIYGNDYLQEGKNKILISVTAENGSVRTYRIYVTREK